MQNGEFAEPNFPETEQAELRRLGESIERLALVLRARREEMHTLTTVTRKITSGLTPGEVLDHIYESFHNVIPYDRIGFAVIENGGKTARSAWVIERVLRIFRRGFYCRTFFFENGDLV